MGFVLSGFSTLLIIYTVVINDKKVSQQIQIVDKQYESAF